MADKDKEKEPIEIVKEFLDDADTIFDLDPEDLEDADDLESELDDDEEEWEEWEEEDD